jgi:cytochrome P450
MAMEFVSQCPSVPTSIGENLTTLQTYNFDNSSNHALAANDEDHTRQRRLLNYAFSDQALRSQENIIISYIDLMISKLHNRAASGSPVDIMKYLNFLTFDITGDLLFDESFGSLQSENYDHWIANLFDMLRIGCIFLGLRSYGVPVMKLVEIVPAMAKAENTHHSYTKEKMARRLAKKTDRKDFMR